MLSAANKPFMLSVILQTVVMLSVIIHSIIMLNVVALPRGAPLWTVSGLPSNIKLGCKKTRSSLLNNGVNSLKQFYKMDPNT